MVHEITKENVPKRRRMETKEVKNDLLETKLVEKQDLKLVIQDKQTIRNRCLKVAQMISQILESSLQKQMHRKK